MYYVKPLELTLMKKKALLLLTLTLTLLFAAVVRVNPVQAQADLNAYSGTAIADSQIDGAIGDEGSDAGSYTGVAINPQGTADIYVKNDGENLYIAIELTADSDNPWVAIMFADAGHMTAGADGAVFGNDDLSANGYLDTFFGGAGIVGADTTQNGKGAITVDQQNHVTVELKKPLNSGDSKGRDIAWSTGNTYSVTIMWDTNGAGSSGGSVNHYNGALTAKTLLVNAEAIPEFPAALILVTLAATLAAAVFLKKRGLTRSHQVFQYR
jgi:hypothetical protein